VIACIRATPEGARAFCGRTIEPTEFAFNEATHAMAHYNTASLRVCSVCATSHRLGQRQETK
jgi:hypothetical protein